MSKACSLRGMLLALGLTAHHPPSRALAHMVLITLPRRSYLLRWTLRVRGVQLVWGHTIKNSWDCCCLLVPREAYVLGACAIEVSHSVCQPGFVIVTRSPQVAAAPFYRWGDCEVGGTVTCPGHMANFMLQGQLMFPSSTADAGVQTTRPTERREGQEHNLLCSSSLVRFKVSFGDTLAVAPVPDFCVFTRLFLPIFWLQRNEKTKYYISKEQNQEIKQTLKTIKCILNYYLNP